jgi:hypothetical protein
MTRADGKTTITLSAREVRMLRDAVRMMDTYFADNDNAPYTYKEFDRLSRKLDGAAKRVGHHRWVRVSA